MYMCLVTLLYLLFFVCSFRIGQPGEIILQQVDVKFVISIKLNLSLCVDLFFKTKFIMKIQFLC